MSGGHGWAMVVSQRSALEAFNKKSQHAARYAALQIPEAPGVAASPMASSPQDAISQAILSRGRSAAEEQSKEGALYRDEGQVPHHGRIISNGDDHAALHPGVPRQRAPAERQADL